MKEKTADRRAKDTQPKPDTMERTAFEELGDEWGGYVPGKGYVPPEKARAGRTDSVREI